MGFKFGEIMIDLGYITQNQLNDAIILQRKGRAKLGQVMISKRFLTQEQVAHVIDFQSQSDGIGKKFGDCAYYMGFISLEEREEAIKYQTTSQGVLGDLLVDLNYITDEQRQEAVKKQGEMI